MSCHMPRFVSINAEFSVDNKKAVNASRVMDAGVSCSPVVLVNLSYIVCNSGDVRVV